MMIDNGLRLATAEAVLTELGSATDGIGSDSVTLALDGSGATTFLRQPSHGMIGASLAFNVDVAFNSAVQGSTIEFQLISLPLLASKLDATAGGGAGKAFTISGLTTSAGAPNTVTLAAHGLPLGTPFRVKTPSTSGLTDEDIYFVVPHGVNTFQVATSLSNARAGTVKTLTASSLLDIEVIPTIHASSGGMPMYQEIGEATTLGGPLSVAGVRFFVPIRPLATKTPAIETPTYSGQLPQTEGAGAPGAAAGSPTVFAANAQRYFYLRYKCSVAVTAGSVTCDLVLCGDNALQFTASGQKVLS